MVVLFDNVVNPDTFNDEAHPHQSLNVSGLTILSMMNLMLLYY
jgi:hypothetical protein